MTGNTNHQGAEQQRGNDGLDEVQEDPADDIEVDGDGLEIVAERGRVGAEEF